METTTPAAVDTLKPDWCFIGLDETEYWTIEPRLMQWIERVLAVYAFNRNVQTNCCELTPSYFLTCLAYDAHTKPDTPDDIREEIFALMWETSREDSNTYSHVRTVERQALANPDWFATGTRNMPDDAENTPDAPDWVWEAWNANPQF